MKYKIYKNIISGRYLVQINDLTLYYDMPVGIFIERLESVSSKYSELRDYRVINQAIKNDEKFILLFETSELDDIKTDFPEYFI